MVSPQVFSLVLLLTRACISEAGFDSHRECVVIVNALVEQAMDRGVPLREQVCSYSVNVCDRHRTDHRRWISFLSPESPSRPPGFPRSMSWTTHRPMVAAMFRTAYEAYLGATENPCPGGYHWAAGWCGVCRRRMRAEGFHRLRCEGVSNFWWTRPFVKLDPPELLFTPVKSLVCV